MKLAEVNSVYFIGIGGIGMSALARWFHAKQIPVAGYDKTESDLTKKLVEEGIDVHYEDQLDLIDDKFLAKEGTLVVYTPAIPAEHIELNYFRDNGFTVMKRSEVLGMITENHFTIAVAGTHGKTTTTSMIAHLLSHSRKGCSAFVGGIMANTGTNLIIGDENAPVVVEADEYDRSFMRLNPNYTIITSLDPDHLDIYGDETAMLDTYEEFVKKTPKEGKVLMHSDAGFKINPGNKYISYAIRNGDAVADALRIVNGAFVFTYRYGMEKISDVHLEFPGYHNVENALAAITVAVDMGMDGREIRKLMRSYKGVKRRFEYVFRSPHATLIDDYAHHPEEINAFLKSVRSLAGKRKITVIFQPHLYSRTNDFKKGFAEALDKADEIILLDIYPAREEPIEGVSSKSIFDLMENEKKVMVAKEYLLDELENHNLDIVVTIGAGDIDREVPKIAEYMKNKFNPKSTEDE
ncbi:UDP-N-acetylmuramate--L-alanine ligase [Ekhidna lutea]|uniref:UDP-N-acetylmuramate--L-alanine ligase n=1 Tax=Ekhidna lutea TaxID=447679 RepID=A0A239L183_EKHLU|nr:UDP-N-acetylmuramate--L-alanine ligase [Ekhidna lutea]SNT24201.1 UDP-N-acetylmuramate--L-alanine ligase [Ekhidna lutea]